MLPAQWPPKPLHLWPSSQQQSRSSRLHAYCPSLRAHGCENLDICLLSCVTRHVHSQRSHEAFWGCLCQSHQSTAPGGNAPIDPGGLQPDSKVGVRYSSGATWSRYLTERQPRELSYHGTWTHRDSLIGALEVLSLVNLTRSSCPTACDGARRPACTSC